MSGLSLYDLVIPTFTKGLKTFDHVLIKAEEYAKKNGIDADAEFPEARLVADQLPLTFQVQNVTKNVATTLSRLTGTEAATFDNKEKTIADLHARIQATLALLEKVDPAVVNSREDAEIDIPWAGKTHKVTVKAAVLGHGLPNFFFHLITGYSILRAKGVPLGKVDYLDNFWGL